MSDIIALLNGPNLNLLGMREPEIYGSRSLDEVVLELANRVSSAGYQLSEFQSNSEGALIDRVQLLATAPNSDINGKVAGLIINPGAYAHTSIALRDALVNMKAPVIEVHISNIYKRESFRHSSLISGVVTGVVCGLGVSGYALAFDSIVGLSNKKS